MAPINQSYARDLDLNLFRVAVTVADTGSVTAAAAQLYLTQPAISAALRRLSTAIGAPIVARHGRGVVLTERGAQLVAAVRPHLEATIAAALSPPRFDSRTSERTFRIGFADASDEWMLPHLLRSLASTAPQMRIIGLPIQFRTVADAFATRRIDLAITVADDLPDAIVRRPLFRGKAMCVWNPRHVSLGDKPTERAYFAHDHVIVSYNGDLRGIIEDTHHRARRVRCSVASFGAIGAIVDDNALIATVPAIVAAQILAQRPHLHAGPLPIDLPSGGLDLLWPSAFDADDACRFMRDAIIGVADELSQRASAPRRKRRAAR